MKAIGIVSEYNPIHHGHVYHMEKSREIAGDRPIVLVMSGNFVQRGEAALLPKAVRTGMALAAGADLVIELPAIYATSSAESFASMSLRLLAGSGMVDTLSFGSESGSLDLLEEMAAYLADEPAEYRELLRMHLSAGLSFPQARSAAMGRTGLFSPEALAALDSPNNILGLEYLKAIHRHGLPLKAMTVKRIGAGYHDPEHNQAWPSATAIRRLIRSGEGTESLSGKMPDASLKLMAEAIARGEGPLFPEDHFPYVKYRIATSSPLELSRIMDIGEGLENRLISCASRCSSYDELLDCIATRRYPRTRIARSLLHVLLNISQEDCSQLAAMAPPYLRVLGFSDRGRRLLRAAKEDDAAWPVIINVRDSWKTLSPLQRRCFEIDLRATALYNLLLQDKFGTKMANDFQMPVIRH